MTASAATPPYRYPLGLFEGIGVELEYMIVDVETLDVRPVADALFRAAAGEETSDVEPDGPDGVVSWSNELALHVAEMKTTRPVATLDGLAAMFQDHVGRMNDLLAPMGCRLLPTGMHPWMNPDRDMRLWPHENNEIYATYDRIFGCRGHGWANLQSTHINLAFADDEEFGRLHAAIRLVLPLLPALAASSPAVDGQWSSLADHRLEVYRSNSMRVPMMAGLVVPEPVFTRAAYEREILGRLYRDLEPLDPGALIRHEWANARGGIARFDRGSIEIRLLDIQECPAADLAVVEVVTAAVRALVEERWMTTEAQQRVSSDPLHRVLLDTIRDGEQTVITDRSLLDAFGLPATATSAGEVWRAIAEATKPAAMPLLHRMLDAGTLSTRVRRSIRGTASPDALRDVYRELADCLATGTLFRAD